MGLVGRVRIRFSGSPPSHGKLLDWLAVDLMENGWDLKRLLSEWFPPPRQSSKIDSSPLSGIPKIACLPGVRACISAEMVRKPFYQRFAEPKDVWSAGDASATGSCPQDRIRRKTRLGNQRGRGSLPSGTVYFLAEDFPYPSMSAFDAPNREVCSIRRNHINTPMQALVTLNDPVFMKRLRLWAG